MNHDLESFDEELENSVETLEDDTLASVAGGCTPGCGSGFTTWLFSCTTGPCP